MRRNRYSKPPKAMAEVAKTLRDMNDKLEAGHPLDTLLKVQAIRRENAEPREDLETTRRHMREWRIAAELKRGGS